MRAISTISVSTTRVVVQWFFMFWVVGIGIRFGMFVNSIENGATTPWISRPPGVEGFLPIGALTSLKYWLVSGTIHPVHPAALVIFLAAILMSLLAKKSFCSWICPVGTLSEGAFKLGRRLLGRNLRVWPRLDFFLRGIKYLLLVLFVKIILVDMSVEALGGFLDAPYWAISDVKMLHFFTRMSLTTIVVLAFLTLLSLFYKNFWCRYLCPYGALLGLASLLSPFKVRRDTSGCTGCQRCTIVCPAALPVHSLKAVASLECSGCLTCVVSCPEKGVLRMTPPFWRRPLSPWVFPVVAMFLFTAAIGLGMATGHWDSSLSVEDYQRLIPLEPFLSH